MLPDLQNRIPKELRNVIDDYKNQLEITSRFKLSLDIIKKIKYKVYIDNLDHASIIILKLPTNITFSGAKKGTGNPKMRISNRKIYICRDCNRFMYPPLYKKNPSPYAFCTCRALGLLY